MSMYDIPEGYILCRVHKLVDDYLSEDCVQHVAYVSNVCTGTAFLAVVSDSDAAYLEAHRHERTGIREADLVPLSWVEELDAQETPAPAIEMMPF